MVAELESKFMLVIRQPLAKYQSQRQIPTRLMYGLV